MGSLRQDLAPFYTNHESNGAAMNVAQDVEDDDWGSDDDAMILGTTPHASPFTEALPHLSRVSFH